MKRLAKKGEKKRSAAAAARSVAAKKAARTRARHATVLKTRKTGEESFSVER